MDRVCGAPATFWRRYPINTVKLKAQLQGKRKPKKTPLLADNAQADGGDGDDGGDEGAGSGALAIAANLWREGGPAIFYSGYLAKMGNTTLKVGV